MTISRPSTRIWAFFFLTWAWSWTCWLLSPAVKPQSPFLATKLMFAGSFGPSIAAVLVVVNAGGRAGLRAWLGRCLRWPLGWRQGWGWIALAVLLPAALTGLAAGLHAALGGSIGASPAAGRALTTAANFAMLLLLALGLLTQPNALGPHSGVFADMKRPDATA